MNHGTILSIIKSFGFPVDIRKMTAQAFVEAKASTGDERAIKCLLALNEQSFTGQLLTK